MELVSEGDTEETIKRQSKEVFDPAIAQAILFQIAFALYAAADKFSIKHYDVKLLNVFLQNIGREGGVVLRYGLGSHVFALRMPSQHAYLAKLADFGTANIGSGSNGQPVTIAHFTTLENTPPDFMILGDEAKQGHEHDSFGLGLCMLHLFTGYRPYEEIMEEVKCPPILKKKLRNIWENEKIPGYSVIRSVIFDGVDKDDDGHILEGDPDETFYHTLYRFLVLFGIPKVQFQLKRCPKVWKAITESLLPSSCFTATSGKPVRKRSSSDATQYNRDCKKFSLTTGNNKHIARARRALNSINGGMDLLFHLCSFDPENRATALHALNSTFMENLRETPGTSYENETVLSYGAFGTLT
jgi:serine/threonine protein kinase